MKIGKILLYIVGFAVLYHLSKTLAAIALVGLVAWYCYKYLRPTFRKLHNRPRTGRDLERKMHRTLSLLEKRGDLSFSSVPYDVRVYKSDRGDYFLIVKKFKIALFTVLKVRVDKGLEEALGAIRLVCRTLGKAKGISFSVFLCKKEMESAIYVLLSTTRYSVLLNKELVEEMAERVDRVRGALAIAVASELGSSAVEGVEEVKDWDIAEVVAG